MLDVGGGAGRFSLLAADGGASATGIDAAARMIEVARERVPDARFDVGDIQFPYDDGRPVNDGRVPATQGTSGDRKP